MHFSRGECLLSYWLRNKGLTQAELSRRTGWSTRMISYWCNNEKPMSVEAMYSVAIALGIHMEELYQWKLEAKDNRK